MNKFLAIGLGVGGGFIAGNILANAIQNSKLKNQKIEFKKYKDRETSRNTKLYRENEDLKKKVEEMDAKIVYMESDEFKEKNMKGTKKQLDTMETTLAEVKKHYIKKQKELEDINKAHITDINNYEEMITDMNKVYYNITDKLKELSALITANKNDEQKSKIITDKINSLFENLSDCKNLENMFYLLNNFQLELNTILANSEKVNKEGLEKTVEKEVETVKAEIAEKVVEEKMEAQNISNNKPNSNNRRAKRK